MVRTLRTWATVVVALCFWLTASAGQDDRPTHRSALFPGSQVVLQDGDIILNTSPNILGALNGFYGFPRGRYAHAMVVVAHPDGGVLLLDFTDDEGFRARDASVLTGTNELALVRPRFPVQPDALWAAMKALESRPLSFDVDMQWPALDSNATYCVGFISQLFRLAGLPDPYPANTPRDVTESYMTHWAAQHLGLDLLRIVSPNRVLINEQFSIVARYRPQDALAALPRIVATAVTRKVEHYIEHDGLQQAPPGAGSRLLIGMASVGMLEQSLLAQMPEQRRAPLAQLLEYFSLVQTRVARHIRLHDEHPWTEQDIEQVAGLIADGYRDRYFIKSAAR